MVANTTSIIATQHLQNIQRTIGLRVSMFAQKHRVYFKNLLILYLRTKISSVTSFSDWNS